jgi:MFS family permease
LSHLCPRRRGRLFGYYDVMWAVGAALGPVVVAVALVVGSWRLAGWTLGLLFVPLVVLVWFLPSPSIDGGDDPLTVAGVRRLAGERPVFVMGAGILCSTSVEGGLFTWLTTFASGRLPPSLVTLSLSALLVAYIPGRFVAGSLTDRIGAVRLAFALGGLCLLATAYTFLWASGLAIMVGVFCIGLTLSGLYPTLMTYGTAATPEHSAPVNAFALVVSSIGIAVSAAVAVSPTVATTVAAVVPAVTERTAGEAGNRKCAGRSGSFQILPSSN